ncbi:hypothetical protein M3Y98_01056200 [Aphelenchoides besseyi]|nr:hypothetical protein M3Y98_01056200 [Aphelenchoides besseyi]
MVNSTKIRIGHIGAINVMPKAEAILEICRKELWREGVLNDEFDVEILSQMGCGESYEGVAVGADMYHQLNVKVFIGPYCNAELDAVAKMAAFWNIPIIGYMASSTSFADKTTYKTLSRVSLRTTNSLALATSSLLKHYDWSKIAVVTNTGNNAFERLTAFEDIFHRYKIEIVKKVIFEENIDSKGIIETGHLDDLRASARIIVCIFSSTREMSIEFMKAAKTAGIKEHDFVFILPWLQAEAKDASPWIGPDGQTLQNVKDDFANVIIIDDVNGFDNALLTPFRERLETNGLSANIYGYIHLYDSLKLYAIAATKAINETGNFNVTTDGLFLWNKMRRLEFPGLVSAEGISSGTVIMDDLAERAAVYAAFYVAPNRDEVMKLVEINPYFLTNCDGLVNRSGCMELRLTDLLTGFWPSIDGKMPLDEPTCGFRNERCDYTFMIVIGILALENRALSRTSWRIFRDDMRIVNSDELSIGSTRTKLSNMNAFAKHHAIIGTNTHASFHMYPQRRPIAFAREDLQLLGYMKQMIHDNLNPFLGMSFNEKEEMLIFWKFCSRGSVQDVIYNDDLSLDTQFHAAFIRDITLGLEYLHASAIGYHGSLTPWSCLIDRNWMVKLTDYGIANPLEKWEKQGSIAKETLLDGNESSGALQATSILAYEILFRALPFPTTVNTDELVEYLKDGSKKCKPSIQDRSKVHPDIASLLLDCWSSNPEIRPSIRRVRLNTENYLKVKGSLVDQMMRMMENYANNLEKLVQERTGMLEEANQRADKLLSQLLPGYVANELKMGRSVPPKTFKQASVFFSDIVGFTTICSTSSPLEVVTMLNAVYTGFDDIIKKHGAYKVETIGDAYLYLKDFPVPHCKSERIRIRIGLHTGTVAAGVVGITAPRYCLFGDTVNMASRMESTGVPEKIQISQQFKDALERYYPEFETSYRGEQEIKGKGLCKTYFLDGKRDDPIDVAVDGV